MEMNLFLSSSYYIGEDIFTNTQGLEPGSVFVCKIEGGEII